MSLSGSVFGASPDLTGARSAIESEEFTQALSILEPLVDSKNAKGEAFYLFGLAQSGLEQYAEAEVAFKQAIKKKYRGADVYAAYAQVLALQDRIDEVEKLLEKPLSKAKTDQQKARLKHGVGRAYLVAGQFSKAQEWLLGARFDDEENLEYRSTLGDAYFRGQIYPLAVPEYEAVLAADSTRLDILFRLADTYYQQQRLNEARPLLVRLLQMDPSFNEAYFKLANIYMLAAESRSGEDAKALFRQALSLYRKSREVNPHERPVLVVKNIAKVYYLLNAHDSAIVELEHAIESGADDPSLRFFLGRSNMLLGNHAGAVEAFEAYQLMREADEESPWTSKDAELFWRLAVCRQNMKDSTLLPKIIDDYQRAVDLDPEDERSIGGLAMALHRSGRFLEAAVEFEKLVVRHPDDARTLFNGALPYLQSDNNEKAVEYLLRSADSDTTSESRYRSRAYKLCGPRLIKMQRTADARKCYQWLVQQEPEICDNHKWYGFTLFASKNYSAAVSPLRRAYRCNEQLTSDPCKFNELRWWLSFALYETGDKDESYTLAEQVIECKPDHPDAQSLMNRIDEEIIEEN